jgi:hypothetical protein
MDFLLYGLIGFVVILVLVNILKKSKGGDIKTTRIDKNNLNDYYKNKFDLFKEAQQAGLISKEIRIKTNNTDLKVPNLGPYDGLIGWAAFIIAIGEDSSTSHVQRMMSINTDRAYSCIYALISIGIIKENGTKQHTVLIRDIKKIKEIINNLKDN